MKEWLKEVDEDSVDLDEDYNTDIVVVGDKGEVAAADESDGSEDGDGDSEFKKAALARSKRESKAKDMYLVENPVIRRSYVTVAVFLIFFSIIGIINSVIFVQNVVDDIRDRRVLKEEFALFIYPVVINDPPAYDSVDNLMDSTIITSAIWKIILTEDKSRYASDMGVIYVPEYDVELAARSIFGKIPSEHISVHGAVQFVYSPHNKYYEVPENPILFSNSPLITEVTSEGGLYAVTVDYIAPTPLAIAGIEHVDEPIKTMIYTISRQGDSKMINSIAAVEFDVEDY